MARIKLNSRNKHTKITPGGGKIDAGVAWGNATERGTGPAGDAFFEPVLMLKYIFCDCKTN